MVDNDKRTKRGRRGKYSTETVEKIVEAIRMGATQALACEYAGITTATFHEWMNNKPEFFDAIKHAEGAGAVELLARIRREADNGVWQAAAWILERRHPEMYGRRAVELTGAGGGAIEIRIVRDDDDTPDS